MGGYFGIGAFALLTAAVVTGGAYVYQQKQAEIAAEHRATWAAMLQVEDRKIAFLAADALTRQKAAAIALKHQAYREARDAQIAAYRGEIVPRSTMWPAPSAAAQVVFLNVYGGNHMTDLALSGPDEETEVVDLEIEQGDRPLYLVGTSYSTLVWNFTGDTERVEGFLVAPPYVAGQPEHADDGLAHVGVIGLPADRITFDKRASPMKYVSTDNSDPRADPYGRTPGDYFAAYASYFRYKFDKAVSAYGSSTTLVPSGKPQKPAAVDPTGYWYPVKGKSILGAPSEGIASADSIAEFQRYNGDIDLIAPENITTPAAVEKYDVLPNQAGLIQLQQEGKIAHEAGPYHWRVLSPIARWPAEMGGAHSDTFVVSRGVPVPEGNLIHSCALVEDTQQPIGMLVGERCRR